MFNTWAAHHMVLRKSNYEFYVFLSSKQIRIKWQQFFVKVPDLLLGI